MNADTVKHTDMMLIIAELRRKFNQKLDDQLFIIEQQRDRIDYQQQQINDQRVIIEELAWQIRDLRDSVRKCNENIRSTNIERSENKINTILVSIDPNETKSKHVEDAIYESINFDASPIHLESKRLPRQQAIDTDDKTNDERDINTFLRNCIPPPPTTSPPKYDDSDSDLDPIQISSETFEKLNKLYEMRHFIRSDSLESNDLDEIVYRPREFKDYSLRTKRGSSKTLCSLVSDYEVNYLPRLDEEEENDFQANGMADKSIQKHILRQKSDEEVYI